MANSFSSILSSLVVATLPTLRENCIISRLVNSDTVNTAPAGYGDTVTMVIPSALPVSDVSPQASPVTPSNYTPAKTTVVLSKWRKAGFFLNDKERGLLLNGGRIGQAGEAMKAIANDINAYIYGLAVGIYGYTGTAGVTPLSGSDLTDLANARAVLNGQLAPLADRRCILGVAADAAMVKNPYIAAQYARGDASANVSGQVSKPIMGFDMYMDQLIPSAVATISAGATTVNGVNAVSAGSTDGGRTGTMSLHKITNDLVLLGGERFTIAGDTSFNGGAQTYVVTAAVTVTAAGNNTVAITPALKVATVGSEAVTFKASGVANLAFHRDAFAFASRPLVSEAAPNQVTVNDPITGISIRLEMVRQHKQDYYEFDVLYGATLVRPEYACIIAG